MGLINWEGTYTLSRLGEIELEIKCEDRDENTGIMGLQIIAAKAFQTLPSGEGVEVPLTATEFEQVSSDPVLYERIEDELRDQYEAWLERNR